MAEDGEGRGTRSRYQAADPGSEETKRSELLHWMAPCKWFARLSLLVFEIFSDIETGQEVGKDPD